MHKTPGTAVPVFALLVLSAIQIFATGLLGAASTRDRDQSGAVAGFLDAEFDKTVAALQKQVDIGPNIPESWYRLAEAYSEKVRSDAALPAELAKQYVASGLRGASWALKLNENYYEALLLRGMLLRQAAAYEKDPVSKKKLIAEAETFERRAAALEARREYR
jgi:hypothetical protein